MTALSDGLLWPLFDDGEGTLSILFVRTLPTLEQWPIWAKEKLVWRTRMQDE